MTTRSNAATQSPEVAFCALGADTLDAVLRVEQRAYAHPWSRANFADALAAGYHARVLCAGEEILGYLIAMKGVDEVHLLNITVAPQYQRQGWARQMLDMLLLWARSVGAQWVWLEVRVGNAAALGLYTAQGFRRMGTRKDYYPAGKGEREDAVVMSLRV